jgi:glycosyltransferase involved in cell wall biosynthesis
LISTICRWVYKQADQIVVLSPGFRSLLIERGVPANKIEVIYNWADEASLTAPKGQLTKSFPGNEQFRIVFAGNLGKAQALHAVLEAASLLQKQGSNICFVMLGSGVEKNNLRERAKELALHNVIFLPPVPMTEVGTLLHAADALLVHLRKDPLFKVTIPSKTQAYMAVGKPLLMAVDGDAATLVNESGGGVSAESENPDDIARAAVELSRLSQHELETLGNNARAYYRTNLSLSVGTKRFAETLRRLARV